jgi:glycosyltransferase involved in cell wall biosynthesis
MHSRVLLLSTDDSYGGAAIATYRLHRGLIDSGTYSRMVVRKKSTDDFTVIGPETKVKFIHSGLAAFLDRLPVQLFTRGYYTEFQSAIFGYSDVTQQIEIFNPDIVHLHWIVSGFLTVETIKKIKKPLIWTIHDMWAFTGGCHYAFDCDRYQNACGCCPILKSNTKYDLSHFNLARKIKAWKDLDITIVSPSRWLSECAKKSSLFRNCNIETIPNGLDLNVFKPIPKITARKSLSLPIDKKILLFGANNVLDGERKGIHHLNEALNELSKMNLNDEVELVIFGCSEPEVRPDYGFKSRYIGRLHDPYSLALLYSAVDVLVAPSKQDNLPNTAIEAMACGTPVVSFNIGGMSDIVIHKETGYLAEPFVSVELANGIYWVISNIEQLEQLSINSRKYVEKTFKLEAIVQNYNNLYRVNTLKLL